MTFNEFGELFAAMNNGDAAAGQLVLATIVTDLIISDGRRIGDLPAGRKPVKPFGQFTKADLLLWEDCLYSDWED
jgi:hypothetical protein